MRSKFFLLQNVMFLKLYFINFLLAYIWILFYITYIYTYYLLYAHFTPTNYLIYLTGIFIRNM